MRTKTNICADCGARIWMGSMRCRSCALRERHRLRIRIETIDWSGRYVVEHRGYITPCWIWIKATDDRGYGRIAHRGRNVRAHRLYYETLKGPVPPGLELDHLCRNPACVNPDHLDPVTHRVNVRRGGKSKLSTEEVKMICRSKALEGISTAVLAGRYGVDRSTVQKVVRKYCRNQSL